MKTAFLRQVHNENSLFFLNISQHYKETIMKYKHSFTLRTVIFKKRKSHYFIKNNTFVFISLFDISLKSIDWFSLFVADRFYVAPRV